MTASSGYRLKRPSRSKLGKTEPFCPVQVIAPEPEKL